MLVTRALNGSVLRPDLGGKHDEAAAPRHENHEVHHQEHQVVVPAVSSLAPKTGLPDEDLLLDRPEHDQDQSDRGELNEGAECDPQASEHLTGAEHDREAATDADALGTFGGVFEVIQAAGEEHHCDHQSQEQEPDAAESQQLGEEDVHRSLIRYYSCRCTEESVRVAYETGDRAHLAWPAGRLILLYPGRTTER